MLLKCSKCGKMKEETEFHTRARNSSRNGRDYHCKECKCEWRRKYYADMPADKKEITKQQMRDYSKVWVKLNPEYPKAYYDAHRDSIIQYVVEWRKGRFTSDPEFAMKERLRTEFHRFMKSRGKTESISRYIGMPIDEFCKYLESQFLPGMAWDNKSDWHIDHYVPCSYFDSLNEQDMFVCWNFRNLRPLWAEDNRKKGDALPSDYLEHIAWIKREIGLE